MTRDEIVEAVLVVLRDHMERPHLEAFGPEARLNEDLYLDSILMLHLFLNLELHFGLAAPEEAITRQELSTVANLAALFAGERAPAAAAEAPEGQGVHGEDYVDIKVHCFVSCVCAALKERGIDHRAFYFGVFDADFALTPEFTLRYHAPTVSHAFFRRWFERLYGATLREWHDPKKSKETNVSTLLDLVDRRRPDERVMVMLDLFHLPERENKFNQNPFPHYLMLENAEDDPDVFEVLDPDFRWEGRIEKAKVLNAVRQPTVGGGYVFDASALRPARPADLAAYIATCRQTTGNPLVEAVRTIVAAHLDGRGGLTLQTLPEALKELPVLSIRKYAYEHAFAFLWRALKLPDAEFQAWCDDIETLALGLKGLNFQVLKLVETGDRSLAAPLFAELDRYDRLESAIKRRLDEAFAQWRDDAGLPALPQTERAIA
ncbi:DUF6005 family protein [Methylopila turkensis]|uniref:Carrier domain-containing protein n=1 Tax=Methylopila turkensis TaxID=1437816 RepID=A0A9W6JMG4_9HYPH|nr:DUF6005 family protein [Methylopila turkensis]GLK80325.1 hypothetical protein GCM10008174_20660 [Methylopila turkensis]